MTGRWAISAFGWVVIGLFVWWAWQIARGVLGVPCFDAWVRGCP